MNISSKIAFASVILSFFAFTGSSALAACEKRVKSETNCSSLFGNCQTIDYEYVCDQKSQKNVVANSHGKKSKKRAQVAMTSHASVVSSSGWWRVPNTHDNTNVRSTGSGYEVRDDAGKYMAQCSESRYFDTGPRTGWCHFCSAAGVKFTIVSRYGEWGNPTGFWMGHTK